MCRLCRGSRFIHLLSCARCFVVLPVPVPAANSWDVNSIKNEPGLSNIQKSEIQVHELLSSHSPIPWWESRGAADPEPRWRSQLRSWSMAVMGVWRLEGWLEISTPTDAVIWERQQETVLKQEGEADSSVLRREGVVRSSLGIHASILI